MIDIAPRRVYYFLFGILVIGALLRFYHINYQSLWLDELYSIIPANPSNSLSSIIDHARMDQPPLFSLYIHYMFTLFGYDEFTGRVACAVLGLLGILAVYFLAKECAGKEAGLFAAFLTSFNYFHIYYSQELRFYTAAFLFSTLSYLFLIKAFKGNKPIDFVWYTVFTCCLLYTHYFGMVIFSCQIITFLFLLPFKRDRRFILLSIASATIIMVSFVPWMPTVLQDAGVTNSWIKEPGPFFVAEYFYEYTGKDAIALVTLIALLVVFARSWKQRSVSDGGFKPVYLIVVLWITFSYLLPYIRSIAAEPMLHARYTIVTLPAWIVLCASGWIEIRQKKWSYVIVALIIIGFLINMIFFKQHYTRLAKDQFREASELVKANNSPHRPVISNFAWHFNYYFRKEEDKVGALRDADFSTIETFWLLQAHYSPEDAKAEVDKLLENYEVVESHAMHGASAILMRRRVPPQPRM